jgi:uncharacterized RDD family membrane protein YckC/energy-coupling factor transporter ATP-binding protein EcfA2
LATVDFGDSDAGKQAMTARSENGPPAPYVGLRPFEFHEASLFYGRGEHIAEMVRTLRKWHFLAVVGSSGSGKSSLVRAGLLPAIASGFMNEGEEAVDWRFVTMRPGLDPYENLLRELLPKLAPGKSLDPELIEFRRQTLRGGPRGLVEAVADSLLPEPARLVVLVDQFEEIFRFLERGGPSQPDEGRSLADRRNAALSFVDMLLATAAERDTQVYVVLTMRSEYLGECEAFLGLSAAIAKSQFLTPRMTREQIQDIIERPIAAVGGRIEPQVVTDLLNSLGTAQDQLPRVEHILLRMWNRADEARKSQGGLDQPVSLTPDDYRAAAGFESALDQHAEQLYRELGLGAKVGQPSEKQRVAERLFRSLAVRSSQGTLVRRLSNLGEVASIAGASEQIVIEVVEHFRQSGCNFLVATPSAPLNGNTTLDISHEALLRQWSRLRSWIENEAKSAEMYRSLADAAVRHAAGKASLWRDPDLQLALDWQAVEVPNKVWANRYHESFDEAMAFLQKSKAARDFEIAEEEFQRRWRVPRGFIVGFVLALYLDSHFDFRLGSYGFWNDIILPIVNDIDLGDKKTRGALLDLFRVTAHLGFFLGLIYYGKRIYRTLRITAIRNEVASRALYSPAPAVYEKQYAGFWRRGAAALIDVFVWYTLSIFLTLPLAWALRSTGITVITNITDANVLIFGATPYVVLWLYEALMISSSRQATLGKMALGISVTDMNGDRVSFGRATGRIFAKLFLWFGSLIQPFTAKKQALHDKIAGCLVMYRPKHARRSGALL